MKRAYTKGFRSLFNLFGLFSPAIVLFLFLVFVILTWGINFPFLDQWELVLMLEKLHSHTLTFQDLLAQHNEHRIFFPRIIMLFGAYFTHWNINFELFVNIFLGVGLFSLVAKRVQDLFKRQNFPYKPFLIALISFLFFSLSQYENWAWGWQIQIFLNVWMVACGFYFLLKSYESPLPFFLAILTGIVATYSFANGLLYWGIGLLILFNKPQDLSKKYMNILLWIFMSVVMAVSYLGGLQHPSEHPIPELSYTYFFNYCAFVFAYLGNSIFESDANASLIFGVFGGIIYVLAGIKVYQNKSIRNKNPYLFFFYCSLYSILSAFVTGVGRTGMGLSVASSSRYVTICNFFWLNNFILLFSLLSIDFNLSNFQKKSIKMVLTLLGLAMFISHIVGTLAVINHHKEMTEVKKMLLENKIDSIILRKTYPKAGIVLRRDRILKKYKLSYRN